MAWLPPAAWQADVPSCHVDDMYAVHRKHKTTDSQQAQ